MSIGGVKDNTAAVGLRIGATTGQPLIVNPSVKEMKELLGFNNPKETEYTLKEEGIKQLRLVIWFKDVETGRKIPCNIRLQDKPVESNGKVRYVDHKGNTTIWIANESELPSFMKENEYWVARSGEVELYKFIKAYTDPLKKYADVTRKVDWKKLMKGDVSELNETIGKEFTNDVLLTLSVRMGKVDNGFKAFQSMYNRDFVPGDLIRFIDNPEESSQLKYYISQLTHHKVGCKEFFGEGKVLRKAHEYDPAKHAVSTDDPIITAEPSSEGIPSDATGNVSAHLDLDNDILDLLEGDDGEDTDLEY